MSVNPLFSGPMPIKRPSIYNNCVSPSQRSSSDTCVFRQSNLNQDNMNFGGSPVPRKRQRVGDAKMPDLMNESDPFKDFNDTFTEDDLEAFDMIASQAMTQQPCPDNTNAQEQERPLSTSRFQPKTNPLGVVPNTYDRSNCNITSQAASSGYGSLQQFNSEASSGRFSFKPGSNRSSHTKVSTTASVVSHPPPTSTVPRQTRNNVYTRQSNVVETKIYYPHSSQHHSGGTPPGGQHHASNDSTTAQTLKPNTNRHMVQPKQRVQSNIGSKSTISLSKPNTYYSGVTPTGNPIPIIPDGFKTDNVNKSKPLDYNSRSTVNPLSSAGGTTHFNPAMRGGNVTTSLTPPKGAIARESPGLPTTGGDSGPSQLSGLQQQQLDKYKKECETIRQQLKRLTEEQLTKDGEIQVLRQNLNKVKSEATRSHQERLQTEEQRRLQSNLTEKELKKEVESLKTQLQFKEMELMQAHSASQNHHTRVALPTTPSHIPATPPRRPGIAGSNNAIETKDSEMFPTQQTFMADNPKVDKGQLRSPRLRAMSEGLLGLSSPRKSPRQSPRKSPRHSTKMESPAKTSPARPNSLPLLSSGSSTPSKKPPIRGKSHCRMAARYQKAFSSEAEIIGCLLQDEDTYIKTTAGPVGGLIGLVQSCTVLERVSREGVESVQHSAIKDKRSSSSSQSSDFRNQTSSLNVELATRAISNLLNPPRVPPLPPNVALSSELTPFHPFPSTENASDSSTSIRDILPLLEDQLTLYIDTVHSITLKNASPLCSTCPSSSSSGSRTIEDSLDSPGSSSPTEDSVNLGRAEAAVQTSLALLFNMLTSSAEVRTAVLTGNFSGNAEPSSSDDDLSVMEIDPSAPLIDPTQAPAKSTALSVKPSLGGIVDQTAPNQLTNHIMSKLMRIASLQHGLGSCGSVVELSLAALSALAEKCTTEECERLQSVLVHDALYNGMSPDCTLPQALNALDILSSLCVSWKLACKLCNQSDTCLLLQCYERGVHGPRSCTTSQKLQLTVKVISLLRRIVSTHRQGAEMLLETDCQCSMELINAAVLMLRRVLDVTLSKAVYEHPTQNWRCVLHEALLLLHCLAVHDRNFTYHHLDVEKFHVYSITSLIKLYLKIPDVSDNETGLLQDLWEFDPWDDAEWGDDENDPHDEVQDEAHGLGNKMEVDQ